MSILFLQTSDSVRYVPLLEASSVSVRNYVSKFRYSYSSYVGLRRGFYSWQASYNRIPMLMDVVVSGYEGWVCYMDADAYIVDTDFNLASFLADKADMALIAAHSGVTPLRWFDLNNGVFLMNIGHAKGRELIRNWHCELMNISDDALQAAEFWDDIPNDQQMMHAAIQNTPGLRDHVLLEHGQNCLLNYANGRFIRQVLRYNGSIDDRLLQIRLAVNQNADTSVDGDGAKFTNSDVSMLEEAIVSAFYRVLLQREPDQVGFRAAVRNIRGKRKSVEQELKDCIGSPEFRAKAEQFLRKYAPKVKLAGMLDQT